MFDFIKSKFVTFFSKIPGIETILSFVQVFLYFGKFLLWIGSLFIGAFKAVWGYVAGYFWVTLVRKIITFPLLVFLVLWSLSYIINDVSYTFLNDRTIPGYIFYFISEYEFIQNAIVLFNVFGVFEALTIFINIVLVTVILRFWIKQLIY